jgi:hypothetical protein
MYARQREQVETTVNKSPVSASEIQSLRAPTTSTIAGTRCLYPRVVAKMASLYAILPEVAPQPTYAYLHRGLQY